MEPKIKIPAEELRKFCEQWKVSELALFGSVLREDFSERSDIDILVSFSHDARTKLFDMVRMKADLEQLLGRPVDLHTRKAVESSRNPIRRKAILDSATVVYGA